MNGRASPPAARTVVGIDPGLNTTGYGVVRQSPTGMVLIEAGIVRSNARRTLQSRLNEIYSGVREVLDAHNPDLLALEQLFSHYSRPRTAILMGHARGVICLAAAQHALAVVHIEPTRVKRVLTGSGRASKTQIQNAVRVQFGLETVPQPSDVSDAIAIAVCGHHLETNATALI